MIQFLDTANCCLLQNRILPGTCSYYATKQIKEENNITGPLEPLVNNLRWCNTLRKKHF